MSKQKIILIIGVVLALISVVMVNAYINQEKERITVQAKKAIVKLQASQKAVLVAKVEIREGSVLDAGMVETQILPEDQAEEGAATSMDRISGMTALANISPGKQVLLKDLSGQASSRQGGSLSMVTPVGKRAITIAVDNMASLAGLMKPGDYVDIISSIPVTDQGADGKPVTKMVVMPLFQNVLILAVGQETGSAPQGAGARYKKEKKEEGSPPLITIALAPKEANFIAFVQEQGKIRLVLRSPTDSDVQPIEPANWETLFQYLMPKPVPPPPPDDSEYVEIYRGSNKEKVLLSK